MELTANQAENLRERVNSGELTADQANVEKVRIVRVQLITTRLFREVRSALNAAVKTGYLGHMKKSGNKPEVYYHPNFEYLVNGIRNKHEQDILKNVAGVVG